MRREAIYELELLGTILEDLHFSRVGRSPFLDVKFYAIDARNGKGAGSRHND